MSNINFKYLRISSDWMNIFDIISQRKQVGKIDGILLIIHPNEKGHNRGHLHAKYQGREVVISIPEGDILEGSIPLKRQREASDWVKANKEYLVQQWNDLTDGVKIPVI